MHPLQQILIARICQQSVVNGGRGNIDQATHVARRVILFEPGYRLVVVCQTNMDQSQIKTSRLFPVILLFQFSHQAKRLSSLSGSRIPVPKTSDKQISSAGCIHCLLEFTDCFLKAMLIDVGESKKMMSQRKIRIELKSPFTLSDSRGQVA